MRMSAAYRAKVLNELLNNTSLAIPATVYLSLHTADPGETGTNAPTSNPWVPVVFNAAASTTSINATVVDIASTPAATISHVGIWDSSATGTATNMFSGQIWGADGSATSVVTNLGGTIRFTSGNLRVRIAS